MILYDWLAPQGLSMAAPRQLTTVIGVARAGDAVGCIHRSAGEQPRTLLAHGMKLTSAAAVPPQLPALAAVAVLGGYAKSWVW